MAPVRKKARRPIGSMLDTVVQETQNQINNDDRSNSDGSDNHSRTSETPISSTDESDHDETQNIGDDDINGQDIVVGRGHAKMGFEWGTGKVMQLELDGNNNVVGSNAVFFSSQLGILAKDGNKLPLSYTDWRAVSNAQKDLIWTEIKSCSQFGYTLFKQCECGVSILKLTKFEEIVQWCCQHRWSQHHGHHRSPSTETINSSIDGLHRGRPMVPMLLAPTISIDGDR